MLPALGALFGGGLSASSSAASGPVNAPISVNVAGFGGFAKGGEAKQDAEQTLGGAPVSGISGAPGWVVPVLVGLAVLYFVKGRK